MRILLSSGGTGGHVFPAIALGEALENNGHEVIYATDQRGAKYFKDKPIFKAPVYRHHKILKSLIYPMSLGWQIIRCLVFQISNRPDMCIGFGGYPSLPAMIAGKILGVPIYLHEQNSVCGQANRFLAKWAKMIALSFENTALVPRNILTEYTGNLVRQSIRNLKKTPPLSDNILNILVTGGSQGAKIFNNLMPMALLKLSKDQLLKIHITQQCREDEIAELSDTYKKLGISFELKTFFDNMQDLYVQSHLVIARSGASTVAEVLTIGRPAIYVPLKISKENDQLMNARFCENQKLAWVIDENDDLGILLKQIIDDRTILTEVQKNCLALNYPDGVSKFVQLLIYR